MSEFIVPTGKNRYFIDNLRCKYTYEHKVLMDYSRKLIKDNGLNFEFYDRVDKIPISNNNQGVYILYTIYQDFILAYVGKSRDLEERQKQHAKNAEKDIFKYAIVVTRPNNGFNESDVSNLENALYLDFKRRSKIVLYNDNIPSKDKHYDNEETYVLEWVKCIAMISLDYIVGQRLDEYQLLNSDISDSKYFYTLIQNGLFNIKLIKNPRHQTGYILKNSIISINQKLHIDKKQLLEEFIERNKACLKELDQINSHKLYLFTDTKRVSSVELNGLFNKRSIQFFMDYDGNINKLKL